ncbi:RHS repeat domain-containing protein [Treponema pedis]|uniref:YD repeat-containing protein n=1 Tax=Treponema pedis str. T A4 TaxID=1291379 RepID=S5ZVA2_9SPIR|nr:RHS repeat-associated core domain-containing protein [Treponema pedis]AGT44190.1 YD repeat-containing protein [Treponema pedis str. T A4]
MKTKPCLYPQPNSLIPRTAIEREQKQFIKIAFAVHLSAVISVERYRSDSGALKSAVFNFVFFVMLKNKIEQSAKRRLLLNSPTDRTFENRWSRYKEPSKNKAEAYLVYVEHLFLRSDAGDARIFSKEEDVYGIDYGFGLDAPKETEQTNPQDLFAYRRNYTWTYKSKTAMLFLTTYNNFLTQQALKGLNEKNLLTKSSDKNYTVHYRYGEDGKRALKYTEEGRSETLYFNNFFTIHIPIYDKDNPQGLRVHKHIFVGNSRLVTAMTHTDNHGDNDEQREKRYYYHSDHLGSAQFVTDWKGRQYEHIEYTPYGELWVEETAPGIDKLPFRFTGKELDEETGLYYYGARYLDPKYSRWLSGDPALNDYIPKAPIDDEAKKHNENLPGMGGVFNIVNLHVYHYAGNNPVKYTDPDGEDIEESPIISGSLAILLAARGSIGFAKDSNNHIALYIKGELGLGAGTDIDFKQQLSNALGTAGKLLKLLDKGNTALNLIVNAINVPEDTGEGNFNGILQFVPDNYSKWSGNLPTEGAFFIGVQTDKKGRLSFTVGIKAIAAAYFGSGTLYIDLTELKNQGIDELNEMIQSIEYSISNFAYKILRNFFDKELRE